MALEDPPPRGGLSGKVAVIVGGASGIGRTVAKAVARQGANVVIADFDEPRMERTVAELQRLGTSAATLGLTTDVRTDASVRSLARDSVKAMGHIDIVINLAGALLRGKLDRITSKDWKWMLETNLLGAVRTANAFLPHMTERGIGHIVNAVAYGGIVPGDPMAIAYDSGYAALVVFTRGLAHHLQGTGVHVSLYCPGSRAPRIGQNTRTRGIERWLRAEEGLNESAPAPDVLCDGLIEGLGAPRFLILGDPADHDSVAAHLMKDDERAG